MRKRPLVLIVLATFVGLHFVTGQPSLVVTDEKFLIVPGVRVEVITPTSTEAELKKAYPQGSVSSLAVDIAEGETELGTVLFANDPEMRLEVLWKDKQNRPSPGIRISGSKSRWKTSEGITLGSALTDLHIRQRFPAWWLHAGRAVSHSQKSFSIESAEYPKKS